MKYEKVVNGWDVKVYDPNDYKKPEEERKLLLEKKYKTIKLALTEINATLEGYEMPVSYSTLRKIGDGSYKAKESRLGKSVKMVKCELKMKVNVKTTVTKEYEYEILD